LVSRYRERVYHTLFALVRNQEDTKDLIQESFLRAFKSIKYFKKRSSFYTWLYRIAVNMALNFLKKRKKEEKTEAFTEKHLYGESSKSPDFLPEVNSLKKEFREKLEEAINSLPLIYRASFILVVFQGMTHGQASRVLKCKENTVSWRMHKARKMLQEKIKPYFEEGKDEM
jgi:RNA polymerase sigma-70 factor (ECF subfamily)